MREGRDMMEIREEGSTTIPAQATLSGFFFSLWFALEGEREREAGFSQIQNSRPH